MGLNLKYIIYDGNKFLIFPETISHDTFKSYNPTSAGFVNVLFVTGFRGCIKAQFRCYGKSISLGLDSRDDEDSKILNAFI